MKSDHQSTYKIIQMMIQFFIETFVSIAIGYVAGNYLDRWLFDDKHIFIYILMIAGIFAGFRNLVIRALKLTGGDHHEKND